MPLTPIDDRLVLLDYARGVRQAANPAPGVGYPNEHAIRPLQRVVDWLDRNVGQHQSARDAVRNLEADKAGLQAGLTRAEQATLDDTIDALGYVADDPAKGQPMTASEFSGYVGTLSSGAAARNDRETQHLLERMHGFLDSPANADLRGRSGLDAAQRLRDGAWALEHGLEPAQVDKLRELITTVTAAARHPASAQGQGDWIVAFGPKRSATGQTAQPSVDKYIQQGHRGRQQDQRVDDGQGARTQTGAHAAVRSASPGQQPMR